MKFRSQEFTCPECGTVFTKVAEVKDNWTPEEIKSMCPECNKQRLFQSDWERDENGMPIIAGREVAALGTFGLQGAKQSDNYKRVNERLEKITSSTPGARKFESKF